MDDFIDWVDRIGGPVQVANRIGCTPRSVQKWIKGECIPVLPLLLKLVKASKGTLTIESIVTSIKAQKRKLEIEK